MQGCLSCKKEGDESFDDETATNENMQLFSPIVPDYLIDSESSIELTEAETVFLYQKMTTAKKSRDSLLAFLLRENDV